MKSKGFALLLAVGFMATTGCQTPQNNNATYFNQVHVAPHVDPTEVWAYIVFDRVAEKDDPAGLAHYTEHLVALNSIVGESDSPARHANAFASQTSVGYHLKGAKENLNPIIKKLTGVFDPLTVDPLFAKQEIDIVHREYDLSVINNVDYLAYEVMTPFLYSGNAIGRSVISNPEVIKTFSYDKAKAYYAATHLRRAATLLVLGDVTKRDVHAAVKASGLSPLAAESITEIKPGAFKLDKAESKIFKFGHISAEPRMSFRKIVKLDKPVNFDLLDFQSRLLAATLETKLPGGLAGPLRHDEFVASAYEVYIEPLDEEHIQFWIFATLGGGVSFEQLQSTFETAFKRSAEGIPDDTFKRMKQRSRQYWLDWDDNDAVTEWMQDHAQRRVAMLRQPASKATLKKLTEQITVDDINDLLKALQKPGRQAVAYIGKPSGQSHD